MQPFFRRIGDRLFRGFACIVRGILRALIVLAFRPKRIYASEKARQEAFRKPCIVFSNHVRGMDGAVILTMLPGHRIRGLVAKDWYEKSPLIHFFLRCLPLIPIDREHASLSWLRDSRRVLKDGGSVYICPEGQCNFNKVIRPFRPGFITLAAAADAELLPVYHNGEYHCFFGRRFRMIIGEPIRPAGSSGSLSAEEMAGEAEAARQVLRGLEMQLNGTIREEGTTDEVSH